MIAPPPATATPHSDSRQRVVCAATIRAAYDGQFSLAAQPGVLLRLSVTRSGPYALVGWEAGEIGGSSLFHERGGRWCRTASGGGALTEEYIVGFDGIDAATAHRLFTGSAVTSVARAR